MIRLDPDTICSRCESDDADLVITGETYGGDPWVECPRCRLIEPLAAELMRAIEMGPVEPPPWFETATLDHENDLRSESERCA